ncbi:protein YgfX [Thiobacter aerophilum]|uniref:Protein YgfX n=1 Tax=Thiobacter aerophilum TaxID=3121275 RepID=A0ABV0EAR5_9BURK
MLSLVIRPAPRLMLLLALLYASAGLCVVVVPLPRPLQLMLLTMLLLAAAHSIWLHGLGRHRRAIQRLELDAQGQLYVIDGTGQPQRARVSAASFVTPWLTVLDFATERGRRTLLIMPERVDAEAYRRLRVWLRWGWRAEPSNTVDQDLEVTTSRREP